jgi:hypothetical protein
LIIVEHDPLLYEDALGDGRVCIYASGGDLHIEDLTINADRVFYFEVRSRSAQDGGQVSPAASFVVAT